MVEHDYGLQNVNIALLSRNWGWTPPRETKKYILINPQDLKDKITFMGIAMAWKGTGHFEWEALLSYWFVSAVKKAIDEVSETADITALFNRDLLANPNMVLSQDAIHKHLLPWFDIVEETETKILIKLKIK